MLMVYELLGHLHYYRSALCYVGKVLQRHQLSALYLALVNAISLPLSEYFKCFKKKRVYEMYLPWLWKGACSSEEKVLTRPGSTSI